MAISNAVSLANFSSKDILIVDSTNDRVGIASTTPTQALDVVGTIKATSGTFTSNVSVGGTLSYEDVTNIDSVGIITARSDVSIADKIIHTGDTNTAIRFPVADTFTVETAGSERLRITSAGDMALGTISPNTYTNYTTLTINGTTGGQIDFESNGTKYGGIYTQTNEFHVRNKQASGSGFLAFHTTNSGTCAERLRIDSSGRLLVGTSTPANASTTAKIQMVDGSSAGLILGRDDGSVSTDDTLGYILFMGNDGGNFENCARIRARADGTHASGDKPSYLEFSTTADGASSPTERLRITSAGLVRVPDNGKFTAGASDDLQIYHNGSNSFIDDTGTGDLYIRATTNLYLQKYTGETTAKFIADGAVELYHNNSKKLETTSSGVTVTGTVSDSKGELRTLPKNTQSGTYTLVAADAGKFIEAGNTVTVPASVFSAGQMITILNQTSGDITITKGSGLTLYNAADGDNNSRTLSTRGIATILYASTTTAHISGAGLS